MDVVIVQPYCHELIGVNEATLYPPMGLAYLGAVLREQGYKCALIDADILKIKRAEVISEIKRLRPRLVGISVNLYTGKYGVELSKELRKEYGRDLKIIFGGPFPTSNPTFFLTEGQCDAVVMGEGEMTLLELAAKRDGWADGFLGSVLGVAYLESGALRIAPPRPMISDLDSLPFPAWDLLPDLALYRTRKRRSPMAPILTSRGCPFGCTFCSKDVFKSKFRPRSPENVAAEIDFLVNRYKIKQLDILDDNFAFHRARTATILDLIIKRGYRLAINLQSGVRAESLDGELVEKMRRAGVFKLAIGVESGDEEVLKKVKKQLDLSRVLESTRLARKAGIVVYGFFMLGLPGDTPETMQKTIDFAKKMNPTIANFVITIPFPGTELYELVEREGKFKINTSMGLNIGFHGDEAFFDIWETKAEDVIHWRKRAYRSFYFRPRKIAELLLTVRSFNEFKWVLQTSFFIMRSSVFWRLARLLPSRAGK